jgi:hypothetical protein
VEEIGASGLFVELTKRANSYLEERGKRVMFWGERPLDVADIPKLPNTMIDAVAGHPNLEREGELETEKEHGMQVLIYYSTRGGSKRLFPDYFPFTHHPVFSRNHLEKMYRRISFGEVREIDVLGTFIAAWDGHGSTLEVVWLGLVSGSCYGWNAGTPEPDELLPRFVKTFHGPEARGMAEAYRLMNDGALFWTFSWDRRKGIELPNLPDPKSLAFEPFWKERYRQIQYSKDAHLDHMYDGPFHSSFENLDQEKELVLRLVNLLETSLKEASRNKYGIEVMLGIAESYLHNIHLFETLGRIEGHLAAAYRLKQEEKLSQALSKLEAAEVVARNISQRRKDCSRNFVNLWRISRFPSEQMNILRREEKLNLDKWADDLRLIRERH